MNRADCIFNSPEAQRYIIDLPYPEVIVTHPNEAYAAVISGAYGGQGSETTAITQYISHIYYTDMYPDVNEAYFYISLVEMHHLDLLGRLIRDLGLRPKFASFETRTFWSGKYPDYSTQITKMLAADIEGERMAIAHYRRIMRAVPDEDIRALLARIIMDEEKHIEVLMPLYERYR